MGPRSEERGRADTVAAKKPKIGLQWGRAPKSAEGPSPFRRSPRRHRPAMGPRSEERGRLGERSGPRSAGVLQWGRAPKSAEGAGSLLTQVAQLYLQWGRAPKSAEGYRDVPRWVEISRLQWGRAPKSAEGRQQARGSYEPVACNGAALRRARKEWVDELTVGVQEPAMGPRSEERGRRQSWWSVRGTSVLQWGRAPKSAEGERRSP